ncbi:MAG: glycosyltransferase family 2 protein, partial [Actinobacteria bacterium]|nr:glycosyltransferase family 2 protein [Actinomycetota bacterium]
YKNNTNILVIDDCSKDQTNAVLQKSPVFVLPLPLNLGIAGARETGFQYALENNYDIIVQMDADGQHDPKYINQLIKPILENRADAVIGSRFLRAKYDHQTSRSRYIGISILAFILTFLTGRKITDPTCGFSAYNQKAIRILSLNYPSDYPEPEIPIILYRAMLKFKEVPIRIRPRAGGHSSISYKKALYYFSKVFLGILITCIRKIEK